MNGSRKNYVGELGVSENFNRFHLHSDVMPQIQCDKLEHVVSTAWAVELIHF